MSDLFAPVMLSLAISIAGACAAMAASPAATAATAPPESGAPQLPPFTSQAMTLKLDHDEGAPHMCPMSGQLTSYQANSAVDNAPVVVELLGPDQKPLAEKTWSTVAGLRVLPLVQGPLRITMICSTR